MSSTEETYRKAAIEHLERAQELFGSGSYYLVHYLSGLAVECHLRAWLRRDSREFDARHDIEILAKKSGFYDIVASERVKDFTSFIEIVNKRWRSNQRYYSERQLLYYLDSIRAEFGVSGDRWKNMARTMLNCAQQVIKQGEAKWKNK